MQARFFAGVLIAMLVVTALACSTSNVGEQQVPGHATSQFTLNVLNDSYLDGASVQDFKLSVDDYPDHVVVNVNAEDAKGLKAVFLEMNYDPAQYRPMTVAHGKAMGNDADMLCLQIFKDPGKVSYGQVLKNYTWRTGFTGSDTVASVMFRKSAALVDRAVSMVPDNSKSVTTLAFDTGTNTLSWPYYNSGDYNQNSRVDLPDLAQVGINFGLVAPNPPGFFDPAGSISVVDGDGNGTINVADVATIGINWQKSAEGGYHIYNSQNLADWPGTNYTAAPTTPALDTVAFATATGTPSDRKTFSYVVAAPVANDYYWVRPYDGTSDGASSTTAGGLPPTLTLTLTNPPAVGNGSAANPYQVDTTTDYVFQLVDVTDGDVSTNMSTTYDVSDSAGLIPPASSTLNVDDAFSGTFNVVGHYPDSSKSSNAVYFTTGAGNELEIYPDPADTDWTSTTGTGTDVDPRVLDAADLTRQYGFLADDKLGAGGTSVDVNTLTWDALPPFIATWIQNGTFEANQFTSGYVFAMLGASTTSNFYYVETHALP